MSQERPHEPLTSAAVAPRPHSTDRPGEHDASKGIRSRRGLLDEESAAAAAGSAADAAAAALNLGALQNAKPASESQSQTETKPVASNADDNAAAAEPEATAAAGAAADQQGGEAAPAPLAAADTDDYEEAEDYEAGPANLDELMAALEHKLALGEGNAADADLLSRLKQEPVLSSLTLQGVSDLITSGKARRIIVMVGAGVSVSACIPDFRTPGTGLYSQLERFGLPEPEAVFSIGFFKKNPKPFHLLAKELFPGNYAPTPTHHFIKLLHDKGLLLRCFTQNIDSLEHQAGLPQAAVVAAHGNFDSAHCIKCGREHSVDHVKQAVFSDNICTCDHCGAYVKPDIVFFGEQLPDRFYERMEYDFPTCDLLLVMGTSLVVHPFASLIDAVPDHVPRVLINRERVGEGMGSMLGSLLGFGGGGFVFEGAQGAYRDVLYLGDTDVGVRELAELLGWGQELEALIKAGGIAGPGGSGNSSSSSSSSSTTQKETEASSSSNAAQGEGKPSSSTGGTAQASSTADVSTSSVAQAQASSSSSKQQTGSRASQADSNAAGSGSAPGPAAGSATGGADVLSQMSGSSTAEAGQGAAGSGAGGGQDGTKL